MLSHQRDLGRDRRAGAAPRASALRRSPSSPGSTPPPSTAPSASARTGASAGPRPRASPRCSRRPARRFDSFPRDGGAICRAAATPPTCRCSAWRRRGPAASSTARVFPSARAGTRCTCPAPASDGTYALEVTGDSMLPLYRDGDRLVLSPTAQLRRGDRVVVRTRDGEVMAKMLHRQTGQDARAALAQPRPSAAGARDEGRRDGWRGSSGRASSLRRSALRRWMQLARPAHRR